MNTPTLHRYALDGSQGERKKKTDCPHCGGKKCFTLYKDYAAGTYIDFTVGFCDRSNKCGINFTPKEYFKSHPESRIVSEIEPVLAPVIEKVVHLPYQVLKATLNGYNANSFIKGCAKLFTKEKIEKAIVDYRLGTIQAFSIETDENRSISFPFIDKEYNVRAIQAKLFDDQLKTVKVAIGEKDYKALWIHTILKRNYTKKGEPLPVWLKEYETQSQKVTCLFGEHLLNKYRNKPVALVESPKSAVLASMVYDEWLWLATSALTYLNKERCQVLKGRNVLLIPDCGIPNKYTGKTCLDIWKERVEEVKHIAHFQFSTLLEERTTYAQKEAGYDIGDLILNDMQQPPISLQSKDLLYKGLTKTGKDFDCLSIVSFWSHGLEKYRILFDKEDEPAALSKATEALAKFFEIDFRPGMIDGLPCLINVSK